MVRFKGGDNFVFGRGFEEVLACAAAGVPVTVIPGLTVRIAVPARAGIPVTHRGVAHEFTVVSGHLPPGHPDSLVDWDALAGLRGTLVLMMAVENAPAIAEALVAGGRAADTPVAVVVDGTMPASAPCSPPSAPLADDLAADAGAPAGDHRGRRGGRGRAPEHTTRRGLSSSRSTDPADPRLADYRDLRDVELRKHLEAEHGLFLAEGEKVVRRAVEAGFDAALVPDGAALAGRARRRARAHRRALLRGPRGAGRGGHRLPRPPRRAGLARSADRCRRVDAVLAGARSVLVLEDIVDHTNVGAIFRSGAALGFDAVLLAPRCADPLYRRSIKVAMGAVFSLPWTRLPDWYDALPASRRAASPRSR